jgi:virulence factor
LFIHPIDNILQLFGNATVKNISIKKDAGEISCSITLLHHNGVMGTVQLSTHYSWSNPRDVIEIVTASEIITAEYPNQLRSYEKPTSVFGVPLDKVLKNKVTTNTYFNNTGIIPSGENNSLFIQGFYGEVEAFAQLVENNQQQIGLESLIDTYAILETIKKHI